MGLFDSDQTRINRIKDELKDKSDEELKEIAGEKAKTSFLGLTAGKKMLLKTAAFQLLREREFKK